MTYRHIAYVEERCTSLDLDRVRWQTVAYTMSRYGGGGNVSIINKSGNYETYPIVPFSGPKEYIEYYPDCCRYYPDTLSGKPLSLTERYLDGKCGFVGISVHTHYSKNDQIITDRQPSGLVWVIDNAYQISDDLRGR